MGEEYDDLVRLVEAGTPLKEYPETLRLCVLRLKWLGIDVSRPIHPDDFAMAAWAVRQARVRGDMGWVERAMRGEIEPRIAQHDALLAQGV